MKYVGVEINSWRSTIFDVAAFSALRPEHTELCIVRKYIFTIVAPSLHTECCQDYYLAEKHPIHAVRTANSRTRTTAIGVTIDWATQKECVRSAALFIVAIIIIIDTLIVTNSGPVD